ncbi:MAG: hypothetical protein IJQ50_01115, partial [Clostridia bacterium]|nr:hypothetical protein [Clostridia bacterium]
YCVKNAFRGQVKSKHQGQNKTKGKIMIKIMKNAINKKNFGRVIVEYFRVVYYMLNIVLEILKACNV